MESVPPTSAFFCRDCNLEFSKKGNLVRHEQSERHIACAKLRSSEEASNINPIPQPLELSNLVTEGSHSTSETFGQVSQSLIQELTVEHSSVLDDLLALADISAPAVVQQVPDSLTMAMIAPAIAGSTSTTTAVTAVPLIPSVAQQSFDLSLPVPSTRIPKGQRKCIQERDLPALAPFLVWSRSPLGYATTGSGRRMNSERTAKVLSEDTRYLVGLFLENHDLSLQDFGFKCFTNEQSVTTILTRILELSVSSSRVYNLSSALEKAALFGGIDKGSTAFAKIVAIKRQAAAKRKREQRIAHHKKSTSSKWMSASDLSQLARKLKRSMDNTISVHTTQTTMHKPFTLRQALDFQKQLLTSFFVLIIPQRTQVIKNLQLGTTLFVSDG